VYVTSNYDTCSKAAKEGNWKYFGLQWTQPSGNSQCWVGNDIDFAKSMGIASNCQDLNGIQVGGSCSNAIYTTDPISGSAFYLILQEDGNMCIYRGSDPGDNQGSAVWCTMTNGKQKDPNPQFSASKGKYGRNYIKSGETLAPNEFVGSSSGSMYLLMQTDGNLVLYTSSKSGSCTKNTSGNTVGGGWVNAVYQLDNQGYLSNMGNVGFVDNESVLYTYPSTNTKFTNSYTEFKGMDTVNNDLPGKAFGNASFEQCKSACDNNPDCAGYVTNADGTLCLPKSSGMYPKGATQVNVDRTLYVRGKTIISPPLGASSKITEIDSATFQNYVKGGDLPDSVGLANATSVQKQQLSQLQDRLQLLASQIANSTQKLSSGNTTINAQSQKNVGGLQDYVKQMNLTKKKTDFFNTNIENIANESDIKILQQNYNYMFWTILATATILVAMSIPKRIT
jgi:hypothetical protein